MRHSRLPGMSPLTNSSSLIGASMAAVPHKHHTGDPVRAPVVAQIYTWRTVDKLGVPEITARLNADHGACRPPDPATGWTTGGVISILANPKSPATWCSAAAAPTQDGAASPFPATSGSGLPNPCIRPSSPAPPGTPPRPSALNTAPPRDGDTASPHPR